MAVVEFSPDFKRAFQKLDPSMKLLVETQLRKLRQNPEVGKPMRNQRKGTRELYIGSYRLSYALDGEVIIILALYHKDKQ